MTTEEGRVRERMASLALRRQVKLRALRIEALWDKLAMALAPLLRVVVQQAKHDVNLLIGVHQQLLGGALAHNSVFRENDV